MSDQPSYTVVALPDINFQSLVKQGVLYIRADDVADWILACAKVAQDNSFPQAATFAEGIEMAIRRARVADAVTRWSE